MKQESSFFRARFVQKDSNDVVLGQFISRYYLSTLLTSKNDGICLDGGNRIWDVDSNSFQKVIQYLSDFSNSNKKNNKLKF